MILPYIEQGNLFDTIDFSVGLRDGVIPSADPTGPARNRAAKETAIEAFLCPSDGMHNEGLLGGRSDGGGTAAVTNYKACAGSNWNWGPFAHPNTLGGRNGGNPDGLNMGNGILCSNQQNTNPITRFRDLKDGTSNTFIVGEALPDLSRWNWWYNSNAVTATCAIPLNRGLRVPRNISNWPENFSFNSRHPGGGNFALGDGGVRFVSESISTFVYRGMATISSGEIAILEN